MVSENIFYAVKPFSALFIFGVKRSSSSDEIATMAACTLISQGAAANFTPVFPSLHSPCVFFSTFSLLFRLKEADLPAQCQTDFY